LALLFMAQWFILFTPNTPAWDAAHYYGYARSMVFDGDLDITNELEYLSRGKPGFSRSAPTERLNEAGGVFSPFAIGTSLLFAPLVALLRPVAAAVGALTGEPAPPTGYGAIFILPLSLFSSLLGLLAFWASARVANKIVMSRWAAIAATGTMMAASPLLYYMYREPLYAHAATALVSTIVLVLWLDWDDDRSMPWQSAALGLAIGFATLVRWQQLIYIVLPIATTVARISRRPHDWPRQARRLAIVTISAVVVLTVQLCVWRLREGAWLTIPQGPSFIDWRSPFFVDVLVSSFKGAFTWWPLVIPSMIGLFMLARRQPRRAAPMILVLAAQIYIMGSIVDWYGGGGFGPRRLSGEIGILIVGFAYLLSAIPRAPRNLLAVALAIAFGIHQLILVAFFNGNAIGGEMTGWYPTPSGNILSLSDYLRQIVGFMQQSVKNPRLILSQPNSPLGLAIGGQLARSALLTVVVGGVTASLVFVTACVQNLITKNRLRQLAIISVPVIMFLVIALDWWVLRS